MHQYLEDIEEIMNKTRNYQAEDVVNENEELLLSATKSLMSQKKCFQMMEPNLISFLSLT